MSWVTHRNNIIAISVISVFFLLGFGKTVNLGLTEEILSTGITVAQVIAVGMAYIAIALWKRYI